MTKGVNLLTEWAINKIRTEYPDDVALLVAVEGASVNDDEHGVAFDYFIPATERGNELAQTFIIGGVGNDLYPRTWERTERTASLDDLATPCLGDAKILYARTKEEEERFKSIRQTLFDNLANPTFVYKKALENLSVAMDLYRTMLFEKRLYRVRGLAGYIHYYLTISVACLNKTYRKDWHRGTIEEISQWKDLPDRFVEDYRSILSAHTSEEMKSCAHLLIASTREFIARHKPRDGDAAKTPDYQWLADWYQEIRTWWNRLYYFCEIKDADSGFREACQLQSELDIVCEEFGLGEMDLLGCFDASNLEPLSHRAAALEQKITATVERQGITIKRYDTLEAFLAAAK